MLLLRNSCLIFKLKLNQFYITLQAAERLIDSSNIVALILSNAPSGVYTEKIEASNRENCETQGRKVFY